MDRSVVVDLLPAFASNRERWPLWTYGRDRPARRFLPEVDERRTWYACSSWPERLAWSALHRLEETEREVSEAVRSWGCQLGFWEPEDETIFAFPTKKRLAVPDNLLIRADSRSVEIRIPTLLHLEALAVIAQYAFAVPESTDAIQPVDFELTLLDAPDRDELAHCLLDAVLRPYGEFSSPMDPSAFASVLHRGLHDVWFGLSTRKLKADLGSQVLQAAGLLPDRTGGAKQSVGRERLLALYEEALDIAASVRSYSDDDVKSSVIELANHDSRFSAVDIEKARRDHSGSKLLRLAARLRHPFLNAGEVEFLTEPRSRYSNRKAARKLVMDRLPRYDSRKDDRAFQTMLSAIR